VNGMCGRAPFMHSFLHYITDTKLAPRGPTARRLSHAKALGSWNPPARPESAQRWKHFSAYGSAAKEGNLGRGEASSLEQAEPTGEMRKVFGPEGDRRTPRRLCRAALPSPDRSTPARSGRQRAARRSLPGPSAGRPSSGGRPAGRDAPSREDGRPRWEGDPAGKEGRAFW
jgi:hypothetical protein